jgi:hypothetical protein
MRRLSILAAALTLPATAPAQQADTHAIVGARVLTVSGAAYERATIVLRDGLIEAVGPDVTPPPGARVLDGAGLVVTPGLVDALSATGLPAPARVGPGGGPRDVPAPPPLTPQALALDRVKAADVSKARDGGITTALVVPKEGVLPGQSVILNLGGDGPEAMVLRQPAALHLHMASLSRQYPDSLMGTMAYVRLVSPTPRAPAPPGGGGSARPAGRSGPVTTPRSNPGRRCSRAGSPSSSPATARTTSGAPSPSPTSGSSGSSSRTPPRRRGSPTCWRAVTCRSSWG